ncbi:sensor histidine kinase [Carnobacteriaceae bacterium zg-ZUI252]|nr:sensor histidine kinase [Carnobacteriaceae bacterium zg-ZUI252]
MKNQFKWLNVFSVVFSAGLFAMIITVFMLRRHLTFTRPTSEMIRLISILFVMLFVISIVVSGLLYYGLRASQRRVVQKLQWLILGQYTHNIFKKQQDTTYAPLDYLGVIDEQINSLSFQLKDISDSLLAFSEKHQPIALKQEEEIITQERKRLARDLHDSVSQQLYAAAMIVSSAKYTIDDSNVLNQQLTILENVINASQRELRALLLHLRPVTLENKTLAQGLTLLLEEVRQKVDVEVISDIDTFDVPTTIENHLFRIVQELISNTLRHSKATRIEVYLKKDNQKIKLRFIDNGQGFDVKQSMIGHYGLQNMKERVHGVGGQMSIVSVAFEGTSVDITI